MLVYFVSISEIEKAQRVIEEGKYAGAPRKCLGFIHGKIKGNKNLNVNEHALF